MLHTGLDEGAGVAVSAADDRAVGADSHAVNLDIVQTAVVVLESNH